MAVAETGNFKLSLENLSECIGALEDYRQTEVRDVPSLPSYLCFHPISLSLSQLDRLEAKVVKPLLEYDHVCKKAKVITEKWIRVQHNYITCIQEELKACHTDREKVINQQRTLDRTRIREPTNSRKLVSNMIIILTFITILLNNPNPIQ